MLKRLFKAIAFPFIMLMGILSIILTPAYKIMHVLEWIFTGVWSDDDLVYTFEKFYHKFIKW